MPLLKRKAIGRMPTPNPAEFDENTQVYVVRFTNEIFTTYEDYINRIMFYRQKTWQCETTGKSSLTFEQALESEKREKQMVANKFPPQLRKPLLEYIQFQTVRIDAVVDDAFAHFRNRYYHDEPVNVAWGDLTYGAFIRKVLPREEWVNDIEDGAENPEVPGQYLVQVLDGKGKGIKEMERIVDCSLLSRDRLAFNKNILRKYIRECTVKEAYIGAPWVIKASIARKYGLDTTLPPALQEIRDKIFSKSKKRKTGEPVPELAAVKKARKDADMRAQEEAKEAMEAMPAVPEVKAIKYPIEDLLPDIPIDNQLATRPIPFREFGVPHQYFEMLLMVWEFLNAFAGPMDLTPFGLKDFEDSLSHSTLEPRCHMSAEYHAALLNLIIHDRKKGISKPILASSTSTNTYAQEDREGSAMSDVSMLDDRDHSVDEFVKQEKKLIPYRPINERVGFIGQGWDERMISLERTGWESTLVGCINEIGSFEAIPDVDRILNHLVPEESTTKEDVEFQYPLMSLPDKLSVLAFLVDMASRTSKVRHYMEECRERQKAIRLERFELNKEKRRLHTERIDLERQEANERSAEGFAEALEQISANAAALSATPSADVDSDADSMNRSSVASTGTDSNRQESRQEKLKRQQLEREMEESRKNLDMMQQKAKAKAKNAVQRARMDTRRKLEDQERELQRKEDLMDIETRRNSIARVKPLGKDRFFNRYWYFDGLGSITPHSTDRVYVQSPSFMDLELVRTREDKDRVLDRQKNEDPEGGLARLLAVQENEIKLGLIRAEEQAAEKAAKLKREEEVEENEQTPGCSIKQEYDSHAPLNGNSTLHGPTKSLPDETLPVEHTLSEWSYYSEPSQINALMEWLNDKGEREWSLKNTLTHLHKTIIGGMEGRDFDMLHQHQKENSRRSTRIKIVHAAEGYLGYVNRAAK